MGTEGNRARLRPQQSFSQPSHPGRPLAPGTRPHVPPRNQAGFPPLPVLSPRLTLTPESTVASSPPPGTWHPPPEAAQRSYRATSGCAALGARNELFLPRRHSTPRQDRDSQALDPVQCVFWKGTLALARPARASTPIPLSLGPSSRKCTGEVGGPVKWRHRRPGSGAARRQPLRWRWIPNKEAQRARGPMRRKKAGRCLESPQIQVIFVSLWKLKG